MARDRVGLREGDRAHNGTRGRKYCLSCGRSITWRKKWEDVWDEIRYCSATCRRRKRSALDVRLEQAMLDLLVQRCGKSICPSEVARQVAGDDESAWRPLMEDVRRAARRLVAAGKIQIAQGGRPVDPSKAKGAIRLQAVW